MRCNGMPEGRFAADEAAADIWMQAGRAISTLRSAGEMEAFVPQWTALWKSDPQRTPFQHPAWLLPWWHQFGQADLRFTTIHRDGELIGLLPFYRYADSQTGRRKLLLLGAGTSDYLDGCFAPACDVADVVMAIEYLLAQGGFDVLDAVQVRPASPLAKALQRLGATPQPGEPTSRMAAVAMAYLPVKIRRNAMYYRNRAQRDGALMLFFANASNFEEHFGALVRLHGERWRERGETGVLDDPAVLAWHREALPLLAAAGLLHLSSLWRGGEVLGVMYALVDPVLDSHTDAPAASSNDGSSYTPNRANGLACGRSLYLYLPAFSLQHRDLRPGTVLLAMLIEHAAAEGIATIDMLRGNESYKQLWHVEPFGTLSLSLQRAAAQ